MRGRSKSALRIGDRSGDAIHLAPNYAEMAEDSRRGSPSLPGYKLKQVTADFQSSAKVFRKISLMFLTWESSRTYSPPAGEAETSSAGEHLVKE